jgi:hypothetical protein
LHCHYEPGGCIAFFVWSRPNKKQPTDRRIR